ncbi:N-acetylmuramoyl-L-alanine amidase [Microbacteriaceae bacterium 4G12]
MMNAIKLVVSLFLLVWAVAGCAGVKKEANKPVQETQTVEKKEPSIEMDHIPPTPEPIPNVDPQEPSPPAVESTPQQSPQAKFVVCLDPGHQRKANLDLEPIGPGATEKKYKVTDGTEGVATKKPEYVLSLEAAFLLKDMLEAKGMEVIMTRTSPDVNISNKERATIANEHHANLLLRIHADGSDNPNKKGFAVLTPAEDNPYTKAIYATSLTASQYIVKRVKENEKVQVNGIMFRGDLSGFNWAQVPGVLLELGFMSNPDEDRKLSDKAYLTALLQSVAQGVEDYRKQQ